MKLNIQHLLLASVMMLTIGSAQCAETDEALANRALSRILFRVNNPHGHPDTILYQWNTGNPPLILVERWTERWFGLRFQRERIAYDSHDPVPPLFDFSGKNFLFGMLCGTVSTVTLGAAIAYVVAQQSQTGVAAFVQNLPELLRDAEQSLATQCLVSVQAVVEPIDGYTKLMVQGEGQSFVPKFELLSAVPKIKVLGEKLATLGRSLVATICDATKKTVTNTVDSAAIKKGLPQGAMIAGGSVATLAGIPQLFLGSKAFALGCIISSAATAAALCAFASR